MKKEPKLNPFFRNFPKTEVWRLVIDGQKQQAGPLVFDQDRIHPESKERIRGEKGYRDGVEDAFHFLISDENKGKLTSKLIESCHAKTLSHLIKEDPDYFSTDILGFRNMSSAFFNLRIGLNLSAKGLQELITRIKKGIKENDNLPIALECLPYSILNGEIKILSGPPNLVEFDKLSPDLLLELANQNCLSLFLPRTTYATISAKVKKNINTLYEELQAAKDPAEKIRCIIKFIQIQEQDHYFNDANCRTNYLLLQKLLIDNQLSPIILENPNQFDGYSVKELEQKLKEGAERFQQFSTKSLVDAVTTLPVDQLKNPKILSEIIKKNITSDPVAALAQLNWVYDLLQNNNIKVQTEQSGIFALFTGESQIEKNMVLAGLKKEFIEQLIAYAKSTQFSPEILQHIQANYALAKIQEVNELILQALKPDTEKTTQLS